MIRRFFVRDFVRHKKPEGGSQTAFGLYLYGIERAAYSLWNSASSNPSFFSSAQRMFHSLVKMSR